MGGTFVEHEATLWIIDGVPARMMFAGRRWRVSDEPTRLRESVWTQPLDGPRSMYGWRFQGTDDAGVSFVFDVFKTSSDWHVHRAYE